MSVVLKDVSKVFKDQYRAVHNLNLTIIQGEILCLLGPSGCGKTTTIRMIAGFERPTAGSIWINGMEVAGDNWVPPEKRKIGMVFQDYALFPHLNVYHNISFGLPRNDTEVKKKVNELIQLVGLEGLGDRFPHQLSGGQQQRVSLARAMAREPLVLLLDEPFSNLDAVLRLGMREEIKAIIKGAGLTAVLVTHDLQDALAVGDRIAVMRHGEIQQTGSPWEIYNRPKTMFVASFLGRFSLIPGEITGTQRVATGLGEISIEMKDERKGQPVYLAIPPEAVHIDSGGHFSGEICNIRYLGDKWQIIIDSTDKDGQEVCLKTYLSLENTPQRGRIRYNLAREAIVVINA
ncbi:MAG: ABC transporter ATP-binding protein [Bacillota bacterium]